MIKKTLSLLLVFSLAIASGFSADKAPKVAKSKTQKADKFFNTAQYYTASTYYKKAYTKFKKNEDRSRAAFQAGECARMINNNLEAEDWYGKAVKAKSKDPVSLLRYADALKGNGKYAEAIVQYNAYKEKMPTDPKAAAGAASAQTAQEWKDKPTRHRVDNLTALNTQYFDFAVAENPAMKNGIVFTSSREEASGTKNDTWYGEKFFDLFQASMDNNSRWSTPTNFPGPVNSASSDGSACFDASGKTMYYTTCPSSKDKNTQCKIMMTTSTDGKWSDAVALPFNSDTYTCGHPNLSADGKTLFFASNMPGGLGGKDIWMSKWDGNSNAWGTPTNLGSGVNTDGDEMFPTTSKSGKLYYSSNGKPGMGGLDILYSTEEAGVWSEAVNLKSPMNSPADDFGIIFTTETTGYLSSNRDGGKGQDDIYNFILPPLIISVGGRVYDTDTKASLEGATVELFGSDGTSLSLKTGADGTYTYKLKPEVKYKLSASFTGYLTKFHELTTVGLEADQDFNKDFDFPLKSTAKPITVPEIFYDLDKATLRAESKTALDGLIKTLTENPTITIKLTSHTDYRADDKYNMGLSNRRAKSVMDYLIEKGVPKDRLSAEGKGETTPKQVENNEEYAPFKSGDVLNQEFIDKLSKEDQEKAHQYNRRTEFEVTGTTYVPQ
jgi:peptidoglycan-associated lipoprotein